MFSRVGRRFTQKRETLNPKIQGLFLNNQGEPALFKLTEILIISLFLISSVEETEASASSKIDYPFLRDIICDDVETPGEPYPNFSVGKIVKQKGGLPWGRCQLKYWTAVRVGFSLSRNPGDLFRESVNKEFSLKILKHCGRELRKRNYPETVKTVSHCYGSGYLRRYPKSAYSKTVTGFYNQKSFQRLAKMNLDILASSRTNFVHSLRIAYHRSYFAKIPDSTFKGIIRRIKLFIATYEIREVKELWEI